MHLAHVMLCNVTWLSHDCQISERLKLTLELLKRELAVATLQQKLGKEVGGHFCAGVDVLSTELLLPQVEEKVNKMQRQYLLQEQLKIIKRELGLQVASFSLLTPSLPSPSLPLPHRKMIKKLFQKNFEREWKIWYCLTQSRKWWKKNLTNSASLKTTRQSLGNCLLLLVYNYVIVCGCSVTRNYLDWLTSLPWGITSEENFDLSWARKVLEEDHYGLQDIKDRILVKTVWKLLLLLINYWHNFCRSL